MRLETGQLKHLVGGLAALELDVLGSVRFARVQLHFLNALNVVEDEVSE